jgi:hypothetical protein
MIQHTSGKQLPLGIHSGQKSTRLYTPFVLAKQGVRCSHCLSSTQKSEQCTLAGDDDPDLGTRVKAVQSAVLALATNPNSKPK